ncbi:sortase-associated OmpA-like protein PdsO [Alteromonas sp. ASW11-130]|uniref:sortase-associated OmpA-like protein PdsO n=1 Tax=Alteromonas sp. ASW11-130 TaxID=3015775 RepID=UPI002242699E|nr:sortase-associated OmpA-like protein PdsO [Alteromonas sp. ASW11-130]MCW8091965.1 sortase-associated OmpA-like protein PdsO [Alteromonas sp. ASW11-130]
MTNTLKQTFIAASIVTLILPASVAAKGDENHQQDKSIAIGLSTGAVIGAIVAGPIGAGVAGIIGAMIGNDEVQKESLLKKQAELTKSTQALSQLGAENYALTKRVKAAELAMLHTPELSSFALEQAVQFKTGSYSIEPPYAEQLKLLAAALLHNQKLRVRVTGHADSRGDEDYNEALSMQRALSVKQFLTQAGVKSEQIITASVGEKFAATATIEEAFFDRKVVMEIFDEPEKLTANR